MNEIEVGGYYLCHTDKGKPEARQIIGIGSGLKPEVTFLLRSPMVLRSMRMGLKAFAARTTQRLPEPGTVGMFTKSGNMVRVNGYENGTQFGVLLEVERSDTGKGMLIPVCSFVSQALLDGLAA